MMQLCWQPAFVEGYMFVCVCVCVCLCHRNAAVSEALLRMRPEEQYVLCCMPAMDQPHVLALPDDNDTLPGENSHDKPCTHTPSYMGL